MRRALFPLLLGLVGTAILASLGVWQLQRLAWKEEVLARIEARIAADPVPLPLTPDPENDLYLSVEAEGVFDGPSVHVLTGVPSLGSGYRVISVLTTGDGRRVLVDRGFAPLDRRPDLARQATSAKIVGNLNWPDESDGFTPEPDRAKSLWYARDVEAMAAELQTEPVLIVARDVLPPDDDLIPAPVSTEGIPNNHLGYAVQWFGLAIVWLGMTGFLLWRISRRKE